MPNTAHAAPTLTGNALIAALLAEQAMPAAVLFSSSHDRHAGPAQSRYYRDLIPSSLPGAGQQYAFEVDLDACSGCKSCVAACHSLNGLEDDELWRSVGLLHGGPVEGPVMQHVTSACHHCLEPACLSGCPVSAYEKDPRTGIVRHLDDQCIGCQYCMLTCPYDVPQYSRAKGIVRKCDMCQDRLAAGEAPACVQACPTSSIRITVVDRQAIVEESQTNSFLPAAPDPALTLPTTVYRTRRALPRNVLPADYYAARRQHAHLPLVVMLVLTQMSVGAFIAGQIAGWRWPQIGDIATGVSVGHRLGAFLLGVLGLGAAVLHLGRPRYAFRALIGWRTSWLSREIVAFGAFAALATAYAALPLGRHRGLAISAAADASLGWAVAVSGLVGVACSIMIYASTRRPYWRLGFTAPRFLLSCAVLGIPTALLIALANAAATSAASVGQVVETHGPGLCWCLIVATVAKAACECSIFGWLTGPLLTPLRRTALVLVRDLATLTFKRFFLGGVGGLVIPTVLLLAAPLRPGEPRDALFVGMLASLMLVILLVAELLERYLFFAAVMAPKMPGAPAA
jgi:formate dehydrogenase iron-sulfur subunit